MTNEVESFVEHIHKVLGFSPDADKVEPEKFIRFSTNSDRGDRAGWCKLFADRKAGTFGDWRTGVKGEWFSDDIKTVEDRKRWIEDIEIAKKQAEKEKEKEQYEAISSYKLRFHVAKRADERHPYLMAKRVKPYGIKQENNNLIIAVQNVHSHTLGLQEITPTGEKRFLPFSQVKGNFFFIGKASDQHIVICEGYATGATIHEATGLPVAVAFNAGNIPHVVDALKEKYVKNTFIIAADDDWKGKNNVGLEVATKTAQEKGCLLAVPVFLGERADKDTDFNDLARAEGPGAVKESIEKARKVEKKETPEETLQRLSMLSEVEYDRIRKQEAKRLGVRLETLDRKVAELKEKLLEDEQDAVYRDFPEWKIIPYEGPVKPDELLSEVSDTINRFVVCSEEERHTASLWIALTWFIEYVDLMPMLFITSPEKRCGKTLFLLVISKLVKHPLQSSNITPPSIFRAIEKWKPTLIIDEGDTFIRGNEELRGVLNSGHYKEGAYVTRSVLINSEYDVKRFGTFGAKAIAAIGDIPDTILDRSIIIRLKRKTPGEEVERLRTADQEVFKVLSAKLARFAIDYHEQVINERPILPKIENSRMLDNWEVLFQIAYAAGGVWPEIANKCFSTFADIDMTDSPTVALLKDIREIFQVKAIDRITSADLITYLCEDEEKPWATLNRGKSITPSWLAKKLKRFSIVSGNVRINNALLKGYTLKQFEDVFNRYIPLSPTEEIEEVTDEEI